MMREIDLEPAKEIVRESFCGDCKGTRYGSPCSMEDDCDGFKDEVENILKEIEEEGSENDKRKKD